MKIFLLIWFCLEIAGFVWVANVIGLGWMLLLLLASMMLGFALLRRAGLQTANLMMQKMRNGAKLQPADLASTPYVMLGAILFIIPGFFSDVVGLLCFLPPVRYAIVKLLSKKAPRGTQKAANHLDDGSTYEGDYERRD